MNTGAASASSRKRASFSDALSSAASSRSRSSSRSAAACSRSTATARVLPMPWRKFTSSSEKSSRRRLPAASTPNGPPCTPTGTPAALRTPSATRTGDGVKRVSCSRSGETTAARERSV